MHNRSSFILFLIGLFSQTQFHFVGSLGISELPIFLSAPIIFMLDYRSLKHDGFMPFLNLVLLTCLGCILGAWIYKTPLVFTLKGFAFPYAIFASMVVFHRLLRKDFSAIKWVIIGSFFSSIISVFIFQPEVHTVRDGAIATGNDAVAAVMGYALFWSSRIKALMCLPISAFYFVTPKLYSVAALFASAVIYIINSQGSGRSAAMISIVTALLIYMGGKSRKQMSKIGKHFVEFLLMGLVVLTMIKVSYSWAAREGMLGVQAQEKYFRQTRRGTDMLSILMGGRMEFFCGLIAALDKPIIGHGPKAEDTEGYVERYLAKYGTEEDLRSYLDEMTRVANTGQWTDYRFIPMHSYIVSFWVQYGICGLILWLYVIYQAAMYFRRYAPTVPQWYGYLCMGICGFMWDVFFSPFSSRMGVPMMICCILFTKAIYEGKLKMPYAMEMEARRKDV